MTKIKRRSFVNKLVAGFFGVGILSGGKSFAKTRDTNADFMHVVFFWLKDADNEMVKKEFYKHLKKLVSSVDEIKSAHIGTPAATDRGVIDNTYSYSLILNFQNKADQDIYQEHPDHLKFVEDASDLWEKVVVYDSEAIS